MNKTLDVDLTAAAQSLAVANTPFFLIRKLMSDPEVQAINERLSEEEILDCLRKALEADPTAPISAVRPYFLLVALSKKPTPDALMRATKLTTDKWGWYSLIADALLQTYSTISTQTFTPQRIVIPTGKPSSGLPARTSRTGAKFIFEA